MCSVTTAGAEGCNQTTLCSFLLHVHVMTADQQVAESKHACTWRRQRIVYSKVCMHWILNEGSQCCIVLQQLNASADLVVSTIHINTVLQQSA